jgi:hypothetical protein
MSPSLINTTLANTIFKATCTIAHNSPSPSFTSSFDARFAGETPSFSSAPESASQIEEEAGERLSGQKHQNYDPAEKD